MNSYRQKLDQILDGLERLPITDEIRRKEAASRKVQQKLLAGELQPMPNPLRPSGPDPFGGTWEWLDYSDDLEAASAPPTISVQSVERANQRPLVSPTNPRRTAVGGQRAIYAAILAVAACALFYVGFISGGRPQGGRELAMADVQVLRSGERGGNEKVPEVQIANPPLDGFLTVVAILPGPAAPPFVFPVSPDDDVRVRAGKLASSGRFPADASDAAAAVVVITQTPAADSLEKAIATAGITASADEPEKLAATIRQQLRALNFSTFAVATAKISSSD